MNKYYTGIGSRETPKDIQIAMTYLAIILNDRGYWLRSGNADGADQAFAKGVDDHKAQIWLPWWAFNFDFQEEHPEHDYRVPLGDDEATASVDVFHPNPSALGVEGFLFMARNYRQVIGQNEPNSKFVVCWTPDGKSVGGTAQAMRIAYHYSIPILNLATMSVDEVLKEINKIEALYD